ncbi:sugar kinase [Parapedobacter pyrenivorans]|uniref:sugar kinase n=1 Tax=Parapedobacter pyrenivorans TaxID=1305674 RepID=UPI00333F0020
MGFITFGELMLRLTPEAHVGKLVDAGKFAVGYAGSESNVATSLATLGNTVSYVSKLPQNPLGDAALHSLRRHGIATEYIVRGGQRLGTYFVELGMSIRPSRVVYDRRDSAFSGATIDEFDWVKIFTGASWLFVSGITPALSDSCAAITVAMVSMARQMGVHVAFDFNYRRSLWEDPTQAKTIFKRILEHTDLVLGNVGVLADIYGWRFDDTGHAQTQAAMIRFRDEFNIGKLAFTVRDHISASHNRIAGVFLDGAESYSSDEYSIAVQDRFGTGDAFAAGILHGVYNGWAAQKVVDFGAAAFALKHTLAGDLHLSNENEILSIMAGNTAGHVIR